MRLALVQCQPPPRQNTHSPDADESLAGRLDLLNRHAEDAQRNGVDMLVLPEAFLTGYHIGLPLSRRRALPADAPVFDELSALAATRKLALVIGYIGFVDDARRDQLANLVCVIDASGRRVLTYAKTHLFGAGDRSRFTPGAALSDVLTIANIPIAVAICYDVEFPELVRSLALAGARLIVVPTASMQPYDGVPLRMVPTRAEENGVFVAYANYCGTEQEFRYSGLSCIVGPDGRDLARAATSDEVVMADVDLAAIEPVRSAINYHSDRRLSLYRT